MSDDKWKMPEPIFRRTSGSLPENFVGNAGEPAKTPSAAPTPETVANVEDEILSTLYAPPESKVTETPLSASPQPISAPKIEPQPHISEQFSVPKVDPIAADMPAKKTNGSRSVLLAVMIFVLLGILAAILAVVYFVFLRTPPQSTF